MQMPLYPGPLSAAIHTVECLLPSVPAGVGKARSLVRTELTGWVPERAIDDCLLIVSELVTNAVRHGGSAYALRLELREDRLYGEVFDPGDGVPHQRTPDIDAISGRGLQIVAAVADAWGVTSANGGKIVWFTVDHTA
ncbi:ATP-binding protein [Nonomuraea jiangxiensis]|uniref:Anti-sigma regulatory factor (Ser/Thr protein kinase) n=1 Tax=Nonomuraea jiangxiensis TaxID=633440 RepID=A0A1G8DJT1_9ACTN|nr:ATP-binding protein [Nonomuraea jiangxiensis]SDH57915.1 Anti-sigma regulatory factor (Ser/Thr protein kinase) [Nonomuraea jiangxiensis]